MDKQVIALLIPIVALAIPIAAVVMHGLKIIAKTRLEEVRIKAGGGEGSGAELAELRDELGEVRAELVDVNERLDFAERLLAQARDNGRLGEGSQRGE